MTAIFNATGSVPLAQPRRPRKRRRSRQCRCRSGRCLSCAAAARPWWARLLRAHRLVAER